MGRNPKLRVNFDADVQYLLRLKHAIEEDPGYPAEFRDAAVGKVVELQRMLITAPPRIDPNAVQVKAPSVQRRKRAS